MPPLFWFWLIVAVAFAVGEVLTLAFFAAFLALGATGAALAATLGVPLLFQVIIFGVIGVGGIAGGRPLLTGALRRPPGEILRSGAEAMIGERAILIDPIEGPERPGHLVIFGERWPAITADGSPLPANTPVLIAALRHATLVVQGIPQQESSAPS